MTDDSRSNISEEAEPQFSMQEVEAALKRRIEDCEAQREDAIRTLISFYLKTGRPADAVPYVRRLLTMAQEPEEQAAHLLTLGQLMEQVGDLPTAADFYAQGLALEAGGEGVRYLLHNNLGFCLNQFRRFAEAEPLCRAAVALDPERYNAHKNLGVALEGLGRYGEAAECYVAATRRNPRALRHLEGLLAKHSGVVAELPELPAAVAECRALAGPGRWVQ